MLQAIACGAPRDAWAASARGLSPTETAVNIALPEFDGRILAAPVSFKENHRYHPDAERAARVAGLAARLVALRRKPAREKRVAIILTNNAGKAQKAGGAVGLDTPASLLRLLDALRARGYAIPPAPATTTAASSTAAADALFAALLARGCYDENHPLNPAAAMKYPRADYLAWFRTLPPALQAHMRATWGEPAAHGPAAAPVRWTSVGKNPSSRILPLPDEPHTDDTHFHFAALELGNILLALQPPRGFGMDPDAIYHATDLAPTHHYAAFYRWLDAAWRADAIIHLGKHGTLEWLPGKAVALSAACAPDALLGDLPLIYPFVVNDPGEGAQAKRRAHAVIIDHLVPPLTHADLHGPVATLARVIEEYYRAEALDPPKLPLLQSQIWELVRGARLVDDLREIRRQRHGGHTHEWDERPGESGAPRSLEKLNARGMAHLVEDLDAYLCELGRAQIRHGLHILGQPPEGEALVDMLFALTRHPNGEIPSLPETLAAAGSPATATQSTQAADAAARTLIRHLVENNFDIETLPASAAPFFGVRRVLAAFDGATCRPAPDASDPTNPPTPAGGQINLPVKSGDKSPHSKNTAPAAAAIPLLPPAAAAIPLIPPAAAPILRYIATRLAPALARTTGEIDAILRALDGRHIPAGPAGAPSRGMAHVLPTGRNFYNVDPRSLPTQAAWTVGQALARDAIERHTAETGAPPASIALSVWGTATMRTGGDEIAQALALIGARPRWHPGTRRADGFEIIPLHELARPRIDVTLRVSGFFRDAFPRLMRLFDEAARAIAALDEPPAQNHLRAHWLADTAALAGEGIAPAAARDRAARRVFSSPPGAYGTGLLDLIENHNWRGAADLARAFLAWGGWAYGAGAPAGAEAAADFRRRLATVDLALHNQDNREHDLFDSDDYFQFQGGLIAAITALSGRRPRAYFGDSSDAARPLNRTLQAEALRVHRTRVVNPKWLAAIRRHGYKGGLEMAATVDYMFGYSATAGVITGWMYEDLAAAYTKGESRDFLRRSNPWALHAIAERLLEAGRRGLWQARPETLAHLRDTLLETESLLESKT
ncbi:MAG: cobaltochelatase subunit CobN [Opitutaceae bacterium]|nr:cobaltochelatase subunit CobN [Opitutaceae bacterium]